MWKQLYLLYEMAKFNSKNGKIMSKISSVRWLKKRKKSLPESKTKHNKVKSLWNNPVIHHNLCQLVKEQKFDQIHLNFSSDRFLRDYCYEK